MKQEVIRPGCLRIGKDLSVYVFGAGRWKKSTKTVPPSVSVAVRLFKANGNFSLLIDAKNQKFLKGQLSPEGRAQGARLSVLPDGTKLDKPYSLFATGLTFHDESSHSHWDVIYQNPNGKYAYLYALEKKKAAIQSKYRKVREFAKKYPLIRKRVTRALHDHSDMLAVPMYTLLVTYMRVGNETYYKANGHKGLTTLVKQDVVVQGNMTTFRFRAKSGVPMTITEKFPAQYIARMRRLLRSKKSRDFIFTDEKGSPLRDTHFMQAFERYCGKRFYPHIVRSYYATSCAEYFLSSHPKATKQQVRELFFSIAEKLGHKKFVKKENRWKESYTITIHYYLEPHVLEKIYAITS